MRVCNFFVLLVLSFCLFGCASGREVARLYNGGDAPKFSTLNELKMGYQENIGNGDTVAMLLGNYEARFVSNQVMIHIMDDGSRARKAQAKGNQQAASQRSKQDQQAANQQSKQDRQSAAQRSKQQEQAAAQRSKQDQQRAKNEQHASNQHAKQDQQAASNRSKQEQQAASQRSKQDQQAAAQHSKKEQQAANQRSKQEQQATSQRSKREQQAANQRSKQGQTQQQSKQEQQAEARRNRASKSERPSKGDQQLAQDQPSKQQRKQNINLAFSKWVRSEGIKGSYSFHEGFINLHKGNREAVFRLLLWNGGFQGIGTFKGELKILDHLPKGLEFVGINDVFYVRNFAFDRLSRPSISTGDIELGVDGEMVEFSADRLEIPYGTGLVVEFTAKSTME